MRAPIFRAALAATCLATPVILSGPIAAHEFSGGDLHIGHPYSHPTPGVAPSGIVYLTIRNDGAVADTLIAVEAAGFEGTSLHRTEMEGGIMRMFPQEGGIAVPPGETVTLEPQGLHIMLEGLGGDPMELDERIPVTLIFERAGRIDVVVNVDPRGEGDAVVDHSQHMMQDASAEAVSSESSMRPIEVAFAAEVAGAPFACGTAFDGLGTAETEVTFTDFRLYVTEPMVVRADGTAVPIVLDDDI
ncbi:MAG: copper chaperone PCu(A)C [Pseudomonadota bacterium]